MNTEYEAITGVAGAKCRLPKAVVIRGKRERRLDSRVDNLARRPRGVEEKKMTGCVFAG